MSGLGFSLDLTFLVLVLGSKSDAFTELNILSAELYNIIAMPVPLLKIVDGSRFSSVFLCLR